MNLFDKLLGLKVVEQEDLTDTAWWEESVLQGLAQDRLDNATENDESEPESALRPGGLN